MRGEGETHTMKDDKASNASTSSSGGSAQAPGWWTKAQQDQAARYAAGSEQLEKLQRQFVEQASSNLEEGVRLAKATAAYWAETATLLRTMMLESAQKNMAAWSAFGPRE